jgi:hypothetical protein
LVGIGRIAVSRSDVTISTIQTQIGAIQSQLISITRLDHIEFGVSSRFAWFDPKQITAATIVGGTVSPILTTTFPTVALQ